MRVRDSGVLEGRGETPGAEDGDDKTHQDDAGHAHDNEQRFLIHLGFLLSHSRVHGDLFCDNLYSLAQ